GGVAGEARGAGAGGGEAGGRGGGGGGGRGGGNLPAQGLQGGRGALGGGGSALSIGCFELRSLSRSCWSNESACSSVNTTYGVRKIAISVRSRARLRVLKRLPNTGTSLRIGTPLSMACCVSPMTPPITTVCPVLTMALVSASRVVITGAFCAAAIVCAERALTSCRRRKVT